MQTPRNFDRKEDELLLELVKKYGTDSWNTIAAALAPRNARQCRNRYIYFLAPDINNEPWTQEEDELLKKQYEEMGPRWAVMRTFFPGRTDLNIKNRFGFLTRNRADVRELKRKYLSEHRNETSDGETMRKRRRFDEVRYDATGKEIDINTMFETLPYYMKRCMLLENICADNNIEIPPDGVCDEKEWFAIAQQQILAQSVAMLVPADVVQVLPPIPEPEPHDKS